MEFRILGPLEVIEDGQALDLGAQKQRALLAVLLLHANEIVSVDRLIDALWPERPPDTAAKALQVYVSQLRKTLGRDRVRTKAPGYLVVVAEDELDLDRCRRLVDEGNVREALALWRGSALADFAYEPFAQSEIAQLEELRLACLEARIDLDLAAGRQGAVVGELEALTREHPLRERFRVQLMLALYRSGRQVEALDVYQAGRGQLADELGLEPSETLKSLQLAILAHDPSLDLPDCPVTEPQEAEASPRVGDGDVRTSRKTVTVLFAAIEAADGDEFDPEVYRRLASRAFAEISAAVEHYGGSVETQADGALTAIFGVPTVHEDDALRAVRAAAFTREQFQLVQDAAAGTRAGRVELRLGLSTGEIVTGGPAGPRSSGRPITVAARLGQKANAGEMLLDESTHRLVKETVDVEVCADGLRVASVHAEIVSFGSRFDAPMVGRERECRRLRDAFEQAVGDRSCQLFTILGAAGVGKSRLVREFLGELAGATVVRGRCLPYGDGITYYPLMEAVRDAAALEDTDSPGEGLSKIAALLDTDQDGDLVARRVGELIGLAEVGVSPSESSAAVRMLFESIARQLPLVIVFDDIHWGEPTFLDLIEHLAGRIRDAAVLLVCIARPELLDGRSSWAGGTLNATTVLLEALSEAESTQLVGNLVDSEQLDEATRRRIIEAAEGNPLFIEEMLALAREGGANALEVPPTIQGLLAARLDQLSAAERWVIECAAVEGKVFHADAVSELVPAGQRNVVESALDSLLLKELVKRDRLTFGARTFRFRHLLIRDAAYESIPKESRADLHERFGLWLASMAGDRAAEYEEVVGYHLEQAHRYLLELGPPDEHAQTIAREAAERLARAAQRAFVRSDGPAGVKLNSRAVGLLPPEDPLRVELVPNVRAVQGLSAEMDWADRVLTEAIETAATSGDRRLAAHAVVQRGLLRLFTEPEVTARELLDAAERSISVFEGVGDARGLARAWRLKAQAHYLARSGASCADASEQALVYARQAGDVSEQREIVEWLGIALFLGPTHAVEAARRCEQALAGAAGDPVQEVHLVGALAYLVAMQGRLDEAEALIARTRALVDELGDWIWITSWHVASVCRWMGDLAAAAREIRPAYDALKAIGEKSHFSTMAQGLAIIVYSQGDYAEAEHVIQECREAARPNDVYSQIMWRSILAKLLARKEAFDEANRLANEAVRFAADSDFHSCHADALTDLAEVLELQGNPGAAAAALREAITFYELKGNVLAAGRTRSLLGPAV